MELDDIDLATETIGTDRLLLRPYRPEDVERVYRACQDADLQRWLTALPSPYTRQAAVDFVTGVASRGRAAGTDLGCAIEVNGELVGSCGAHHLTTGRLGPEIGYWIAPWARRKGYAAEAARALADWAIGLGAPRVHLFTDVDNAASQAVAARAGFTAEGTVRSCLDYRDGSRGDAVLFGRVAGN